MGEEAIRYAYGERLAQLGERYPRMVVLDADVAHSTRSVEFMERYPERFYNMGIAEANMVSAAAGMAAAGLLPVVNTFSFLLCERALDQIRSGVAYNRLPVKLAAHYGGLSDSFDGPSHHSISDLAVVRAIPGLKLVVFSDADSARALLEPILDDPGPVYFRLCRAPTPNFHPAGTAYELGRILRLREGGDVTLAATGIPVYAALEAAELLAGRGIEAEVLEVHTLKPLDAETLAESARKTGAVLCCEEANILGGLGGAVAETLASRCPVPMEFAGIPDRYGRSDAYPALLEDCGLDAGALAAAALRLLERKKEKV